MARAGGLRLLVKVYEELYSQLGEDFSPEELLKAAQTLIDVTAEEYVTSGFSESARYDGYFSAETDQMLSEQPWLVFEREGRIYPGCDRFYTSEA